MPTEEHWQEIVGPADLYERDKVPSLFRPLALWFLDHLQIQAGEDVLDVACGTGIVARLVGERDGLGGNVVGVDIDPDMIEVARAHTPPNTSVKWYVGNVEDMSFLKSESFDWVLCQQGFQYFPDKVRALQEMHRVIRPNGKLAMIMAQSVNRKNQPYQWAKAEALRKHVSPEAGEKQQKLIPFFDGNEEDLRALINKVGFREIKTHNTVFIRHRGKPEEFVTEEDYSDLDPKTRTVVVSDIRKAMEPFRTEEGTAVPYGFHIAIARR